MVRFTKDNGKMIKHMVKVCTCIKMAQNIMGTGLKTTNMEKEKSTGLMDHLIKGK